MVTNIQHLNEDVLDIIVAFISQRDAGQLALTSRTMSAVARPCVLSSLRVATPRQTLSFHDFILWEDGYRLQYLRKLAIFLWHGHDSTDDYSPLAAVLARARDLRSLDIALDRGAPTVGWGALCDAIVALRDLREFALHGVTKDSMALCERLICKPRVVRLRALGVEAKRMQTVEYDRLVHIPFLRNAAEVLIADLGLHKTAPEWSTLPLPISADLWPSTHTLRLRNMDPLVLVRFCPNLACLHITFKSFANDWLVFFAGDHRFPYTASFAHDVSARLRVLEVFVEGRGPMPGETVVATVRATQPVVFSVECYDGAAFWGQLAALFEHPAARLRYLDVLMHGDVDDAQKWMDKYLPLLSASNILCVRLKLALDSNDFNVSSDFDSHSDTGYDNDGKWEKLGNAAPRLLAEEIPTLRYVAVASGRMVVNADSDIPQGSIFRGQMHRWWRIDAGEAVAEKRSVDLVEISAEEGQRLDEYMRGEAFADTLQL